MQYIKHGRQRVTTLRDKNTMCSGVLSFTCLMLSSQLKERVKQCLCLMLQISAREIITSNNEIQNGSSRSGLITSL